jgi:hypothetical protein
MECNEKFIERKIESLYDGLTLICKRYMKIVESEENAGKQLGLNNGDEDNDADMQWD